MYDQYTALFIGGPKHGEMMAMHGEPRKYLQFPVNKPRPISFYTANSPVAMDLSFETVTYAAFAVSTPCKGANFDGSRERTIEQHYVFAGLSDAERDRLLRPFVSKADELPLWIRNRLAIAALLLRAEDVFFKRLIQVVRKHRMVIRR